MIQDVLFGLGADVLSQMPRLHTLLISDAVLKFNAVHDHFWFARDVALQRTLLAEYELRAATLTMADHLCSRMTT